MRALAIRTLKRALWLGMRVSAVDKLLRLASEERTLYHAAAATRRAAPLLDGTLGDTVRRGPFAGLRYPSRHSAGSAFWTKLIGAYELELHDVVEQACARGYDLVIDVGAAEGYYAIGLARRMPGCRVVAFEGTDDGQRLLRAMAEANGVADRVEVRGWCDPAGLAALADEMRAGRTLVLCDAEGSEYDLLDPERLPALERCDLIVELHLVRGMRPRRWAAERFGATHDVVFVDVASRDPNRYPELDVLADEDRPGLLVERMDPSGWAVLAARRGAPIMPRPPRPAAVGLPAPSAAASRASSSPPARRP